LNERRHIHKDTNSCWRLHISCWCLLGHDLKQVTETNTFFPQCIWLFLSLHFSTQLFYNLELTVIKSYGHILHDTNWHQVHFFKVSKFLNVSSFITQYTLNVCHVNTTCSNDTNEWSQKQSLQWTHPMKYNGSITDPSKL
jgi:hypothetical protein